MAIGELAGDVLAPHHTTDGSPMLTSQAAAVVAAYHHLIGIVDVLSPERRSEVMQNLAAATANLDPHLVMQMLSSGIDDDAVGTAGAGVVVPGIIDAFGDTRVAQLLATTLAIEGQASARLATVFNTIATDDDRKARVLSLTRRLLSETDFGRQDAFQSLWSSMEELLLTYNEKPFVSTAYRAALDVISAVEGAHRRDRRNRIIAGFSMGGYGAANLALRHPTVFGAVASFAGYFHIDDPDSVFGGDPRVESANDPAVLVKTVGHMFGLAEGTSARL